MADLSGVKLVTKKDLAGMSDGTPFTGRAFVKEYSIRETKNGGSFITGLLEMKGTVSFKVWSGGAFDTMSKELYDGTVFVFKGKVNDYNGQRGVVVTDVYGVIDDKPEDYLADGYNSDAYSEALTKLIKGNVSEAAFDVYERVIGSIEARFIKEFAAKGHHDAVVGGLLAHTYKVTNIMYRTVKRYGSIVEHSGMDLLLLGCALHDIGKISEYNMGSISPLGKIVSHHTIAVEMLLKDKDFIIEKLDSVFFYKLLSIVEQHHGPWEERPRTVEAYLIYKVDELESKFAALNESLEESKGGDIFIEDFRLN